MTDSIQPASYRGTLLAMLRTNGLSDCELLFVPSVQEWARAAEIDENDPWRAAMAARRQHDGLPTIIVRDVISRDTQRSVIPALELRGFADEVDQLATLESFLEHLVLHEAAHLILAEGATESDCDRWAFDRLSGCLAVSS